MSGGGYGNPACWDQEWGKVSDPISWSDSDRDFDSDEPQDDEVGAMGRERETLLHVDVTGKER